MMYYDCEWHAWRPADSGSDVFGFSTWIDMIFRRADDAANTPRACVCIFFFINGPK